MAGPALDRELAGHSGRERLRFLVATPEHDVQIRRLLRENPMQGAIQLSFEREPSFFASIGLGGAEERTILALDRERLVCVGRCSVRTCHVEGQARRVGYLGELRLDHTARGRMDVLRGGYRFFQELRRELPADIYFSSIAEDNLPARRLLERGLSGLPAYHFLADFETRLVPVRRCTSLPVPRDVRMVRASGVDVGEIVKFLNQKASRHHFAPVWTEHLMRSLRSHGLPMEKFQLAYEGPRLVGCAALWDQRPFRQTRVRGFARSLRLARPWYNAAMRMCGGVPLPSVGEQIAHAFVSPLACAEDAAPVFSALLGTLARDSATRGLAYFTLGFAATDSRLTQLPHGIGVRAYRTRLYQVIWPDDETPMRIDRDRTFLPEVSWL